MSFKNNLNYFLEYLEKNIFKKIDLFKESVLIKKIKFFQFSKMM
jgi:hypothetical protein